jgi:hypothetical protein
VGNKESLLDALKKYIPPTDLKNESEEEQLFEDKPGSDYEEQKKALAYRESSEKSQQVIQKLKIENTDLALLGPYRRKYSWWIFIFAVSFVLLAMALLLLSGFQVITISDQVLITLLATNTVQVVGLLYIVAKWLFTPRTIANKKHILDANFKSENESPS